MHSRKTERGQAIGELLIGLIGLCIVMIGLFMISGLGMVGVRNTIASREEVDRYSMHGESQGQGYLRAIDTWNTGRDGLRFTNDDSSSAAGTVEVGAYLRELQSNSGIFSTSQLAKTPYSGQALDTRFKESELFLSAANLTASRKVVTDPLAVYEHFDAMRILRALGIASSLSVVDQLAMPIRETAE
ncbi:MAG: hypothetical protein J5806_03490 [Lentisphaeria bacterium]|nr:hypothetical protein [Lentisphaeria bacterium]